MADITDTLRLDIDQALRDVGRVEQALNNALAPVEIKVDTKEVDQLGDVLREVERIANRAATETQSIALAAGRAEVNFEDMARALDVSEDEARRLTSELLEAQAASNRLEDASRDVARQLGLSDTEANRLVRSLKDADRVAESINVSATGLAGTFGTLRGSVQGVVTALAAVGVGAGIALAVRGANAAVQSFANLEDSINAVNVVFEEGAAQVLNFGDTAAKSAGLSELAFNQAVVPIGGLLRNFGFDAREAADASVVLVQRAADLASVYGGSVQDALLAVGAALRGEADPLERYSASISAARVEAFALAQGLARTKAEITPAITLQARYGLILSDTARVSGDYLNTADDLANAQRSAGAEAANFGADLGEVLAPAVETLVGLVPELLEGLRQLVPGFANAADSAADFFSSIGEESGGVRAPIQLVGATLGALGELAGGFGDVGQAAIAIFAGDLKGLGTQIDQFSQRGERSFQRLVGQSLAKNLDSGMDSLTAFGNAVAAFARNSSDIDVFSESYRTFAIQANLSGEELRTTTQFLLDNAVAAGLDAGEIEYLNEQITQLNGLLAVDTRRRGPFEGIVDIPFETVTTRFTTFAEGVETGADRAAVALAELAASAERQQARTAAAFNLFEDLPDKIKGSFAAAVDALRENVEAIAQFDINIAILEALDLDALAADFRDKGVAAAGQLAQAVNDIPKAIEANEILQGFGIIGEEAFEALVDRFVSVGLTPTDARNLAESLSSPQVIAAANEAGIQVGNRAAVGTVSSYREALIEEGAAMDTAIIEQLIGERVASAFTADDQAEFAANETVNSYMVGLGGADIDRRIQDVFDQVSFVVDLFSAGAESRQSFLDGLSSAQANEEKRLHDSIEGVLNNAIQKRSPPKLFVDAGIESGEAFWSGFNQADLTLRAAAPPITGTINSGATAGVAGGVNVSLTTINPTVQDEVSDVSRMVQQANSIVGTYRSIT